MIYFFLFWVFFKIGLFGFGGGMAMISLIKMEVVDHYAWLSGAAFSDLLAISQMTPGPISINTATFVGFTQGGVLGSLVATLGLVLPNVLVMVLVLRYYMAHRDSKYMKNMMRLLLPVVTGLILSAAIMLCTPDNFTNVVSFLIFGVCLLSNLFFKTNPILLIVASGLVGWLFT